MMKTEKTVIEETEEPSTVKYKPLIKPSLLTKTTLAVSFQEVLNGAGGAGPKQMYVQKFEKNSEVMSPATSSRLSNGIGAVKRVLKSPEQQHNSSAKRVRSSKLSSLE